MKLYADSLSVELQFFCTSDINPCEVEGMKSVYRQNIHLPCHKILTINSIHSWETKKRNHAINISLFKISCKLGPSAPPQLYFLFSFLELWIELVAQIVCHFKCIQCVCTRIIFSFFFFWTSDMCFWRLMHRLHKNFRRIGYCPRAIHGRENQELLYNRRTSNTIL